MWYSDLNLYGGKLEYISDDDQDMLTITYKNGILIDVGYIEELRTYFITAVKDNNWISPIAEAEVHDKHLLADSLQDMIIKIQSYNK